MQTLYSSESELLFSDQVVLRTKAKTSRCWTTTIVVSSTCCLIWAERSAHNSLLFHVEGQKASLVPGLYHCHSIHLILHCLCDCHSSKTLTITWLVVTRLQNLNKRWENEPNLHLICDLVKCFPVSWSFAEWNMKFIFQVLMMEESLLCGVHFHTSSALLERFKHFTQHAWFTLSWKHFVCIHTHSAVHADATYAEKEMNNRLVFTLSWLPQLHESTFLYQHWLSEISNTLRLPQMFCSLIAELQRRK